MLSCQKKVKGDTKSPKVRKWGFELFAPTLKHLRRKIEECSHFGLDELIAALESTNSKINKYGFPIMIEHNVIWFDVPMEHLCNIMAVV